MQEKDYQLSGVHQGELLETFISQRKKDSSSSSRQQEKKYKYDVPSRTTTKALEIIQFVPFEETTRMTYDDVETNEVVEQPNEEDKRTIRLGSKVGPGGSNPKLGFRAQGEYLLFSLFLDFSENNNLIAYILKFVLLYFIGYHSSTAPEDFFKKKYKRIETKMDQLAVK